MYTLSADASHPLLIQQAVACARSSSWKGSSRCKAENPRYKCQVRLSAFHPLPAPAHSLPLSPFITEGEIVSFAIPRWRYISSFYSFPLYPHSSPYFQTSSCLSTTLSSLSPAASKFQLLSSTPISISIVLKSPRLIFLSLVLLSVSPWPPFPLSSGSCPFHTSTKQQTKYKRSNSAPARA